MVEHAETVNRGWLVAQPIPCRDWLSIQRSERDEAALREFYEGWEFESLVKAMDDEVR